MDSEQRDKTIIKTSIVNILANVLLAAFKAAVGFASNSIAVILDAVNNLSDALSAVITIVGTKLAAKLPDKRHPYGYGRIEYLSALIVAGIVLYAGITSAVESVKKIIEPEAADYSVTALVIIAAAVVVKLVLGWFVKAQGKKANSGALIASGSEATFDAVLSLSVLASALVFLVTGVSLEAYVGAIISAAIIKAGIEMMGETLDEILGTRADAELAGKVKGLLMEEPQVSGAYDLIMNNYGPDRNLASVHLELPDAMTVAEVDVLTRRLSERVYHETGVALTGIGVYSRNTGDDEAARMQRRIEKMVLDHDWALQMHGFYADIEAKAVRFDVVIGFEVTPEAALAQILSEVQEAYPDYRFSIVPDRDFVD